MTAQYNNPPIGCYLEHANYYGDELNHRVILLARDHGYEVPPEDDVLLRRVWNDDYNATDSLLLEEAADDAIDWLNEQEHRTGLWWGHDGHAGAFGLWVSDNVKEQVEFVSSTMSEYPPDDYRGEWLHINERGNCTLYLRGDDGHDKELWSIT